MLYGKCRVWWGTQLGQLLSRFLSHSSSSSSWVVVVVVVVVVALWLSIWSLCFWEKWVSGGVCVGIGIGWKGHLGRGKFWLGEKVKSLDKSRSVSCSCWSSQRVRERERERKREWKGRGFRIRRLVQCLKRMLWSERFMSWLGERNESNNRWLVCNCTNYFFEF